MQIENEARRVVREVNVQAMREEFEMFDDGHGEDPSGRKKPGGMRGKSRRGRGVRVRDSVRWNDWAEIVKGNGEWLDHVHRKFALVLCWGSEEVWSEERAESDTPHACFLAFQPDPFPPGSGRTQRCTVCSHPPIPNAFFSSR